MFNFENEKTDSIEISWYHTYDENGKCMLKPNNEPLNGKYYFTELGQIRYYKNGEIHRDDNFPALISENAVVLYYVKGKRHRLDGPAHIYSSEDYIWWINGTRISNKIMNTWLLENNIPTDWKSWTDSDKMLFAIHWSDY